MADSPLSLESNAPIGVFDSGIGGLSVLRHIHAFMPSEELVYFADSGFAPYGEKPESVIVERVLAIAKFLRTYRVKAMVVACNTATAAAISGLRSHYPELHVVGVEPGLKPAAALTRSRVVGVLATTNTLASEKFQKLQLQLTESTQVHFLSQACNGLVDQIEKGELHSRQTLALVERYVTPLLQQNADTIVLGCTHYPFIQSLIHQVAKTAGHSIMLVDTGEPVARQLQRLLVQHSLLRDKSTTPSAIRAYTSGSKTSLEHAFQQLLGLSVNVESVLTPRL